MNKFSKEWFSRSEIKWAKNLCNVPDFTIEKLKNYLVESRDKTFDKDTTRAYKSLKAYKYFAEGYVQKIGHSVVDGEDAYYIKAEVMASMTHRAYPTFVCLDRRTGDPIGASCACVAGKGEACSHVAALLFAVEDFIANGLNQQSGLSEVEQKSVTDRLCQWNRPAKRNVEPQTIHTIRIVKQEHGKSLSCRSTFDAIGFDPRQKDDRQINTDCKNTLIERLRSCNPDCNFLRYNTSDTVQVSTCQQKVDDSSLETLYIQKCVVNCVVKNHPASMQEIKTCCSSLMEVLCMNETDRVLLEQRTVQQSQSQLWRDARQYRLTASVFHQIVKRRSTTNPKCLLERLLYKRTVQTKDMEFGLKMESLAAKRYSRKTGKQLIEKGFVVDSDKGFLGASVDRVTADGLKIVELKNPSSTWKMSLEEACEKLQCLKFDENNVVKLNPNNQYYTQIQGQMGILRIDKCDFVLCTETDMLIEEVTFDAVFWYECKEKLTKFFENLMAPEIVYPRVRYSLDPVDLSRV